MDTGNDLQRDSPRRSRLRSIWRNNQLKLRSLIRYYGKKVQHAGHSLAQVWQGQFANDPVCEDGGRWPTSVPMETRGFAREEGTTILWVGDSGYFHNQLRCRCVRGHT